MTPEETRREEIRIASLPGMQEKFKEAMGEVGNGDHVAFRNKTGIITDLQINQGSDGREYIIANAGFGWIETQYLIRLPLSIDPGHPERGLWGMMDWTKYFIESGGPDGEIAVYEQPFIEYSEELGISVKSHPIITEQPYLALLLALAHQWNVEVGK
jgi:hypothetical protein